MARSGERRIPVDGVDLCLETFGAQTDPPILLIGNSMLTWEDGLCERVSAGGRFVIRYDLRDTGRSTAVDTDAPTYTLRDLVRDAVTLLDALELPRAHVVGFGVGGWIAQLVALDHREHVATLTLIGTRPTAPGPNDPDLPEHSSALMDKLMSGEAPTWDDREAALDALVNGARDFSASPGFDAAEAREHVSRIFDRTVDAAPAGADLASRHRSDQMATAFAAMDSGERWRERLRNVSAPTLVIHGALDPFFPLGNGEALAREIPGADLVTVADCGQELPHRVWDTVLGAVLRHTSADRHRTSTRA